MSPKKKFLELPTPKPSAIVTDAHQCAATLSTRKQLSVAVVVLNWNNAGDTLACLASLRESTMELTLIAVDNGSTDGSAAAIESSGLCDVLIRTGANLGYAGGNNAGLSTALTVGHDVVMVLNNDTVAHPAMVERLLTALPEDQPRTALSPRIVYHGSDDEVWFAGGIVDRGWPRHLQSAELEGAPEGNLRPSEVLTGCCIIATAETWRLTGLFDDRYFLIFEDSDWSMRARALGVNLLICQDARLEHRVSRSFRTGPSSLLGSYYFTRNGLRFQIAWQRAHVPHFLVREVFRPTVRSLRRGSDRRAALFRLLGVIGCLTGQTGPAGRRTQRLAGYLTPNTATTGATDE